MDDVLAEAELSAGTWGRRGFWHPRTWSTAGYGRRRLLDVEPGVIGDWPKHIAISETVVAMPQSRRLPA